MIRSKTHTLSEQVLSNGAYKFVALVASMILWLTVLGRKEAVVNRDLPLKFQMKPSVTAIYDTNIKLQIKATGSRRVIKEFMEKSEPIIIDLKDRGPGIYSVPLSLANLKLPRGLRLLAFKPNNIEVELKSKDENDNSK